MIINLILKIRELIKSDPTVIDRSTKLYQLLKAHLNTNEKTIIFNYVLRAVIEKINYESQSEKKDA